MRNFPQTYCDEVEADSLQFLKVFFARLQNFLGSCIATPIGFVLDVTFNWDEWKKKLQHALERKQ